MNARPIASIKRTSWDVNLGLYCIMSWVDCTMISLFLATNTWAKLYKMIMSVVVFFLLITSYKLFSEVHILISITSVKHSSDVLNKLNLSISSCVQSFTEYVEMMTNVVGCLRHCESEVHMQQHLTLSRSHFIVDIYSLIWNPDWKLNEMHPIVEVFAR